MIAGYTVRLRPDSELQHMSARMSIAVEGNAAPEVRAESLEAFDMALGRIRLAPGIGNTETSILLSSCKA